jgi:hypothetical protein
MASAQGENRRLIRRQYGLTGWSQAWGLPEVKAQNGSGPAELRLQSGIRRWAEKYPIGFLSESC